MKSTSATPGPHSLTASELNIVVQGMDQEPNDEQVAVVSVEVEFEVPYFCLTEKEAETPGIAETCAHITALGNLWIALRGVGYDVGELLESIESRYQGEGLISAELLQNELINTIEH